MANSTWLIKPLEKVANILGLIPFSKINNGVYSKIYSCTLAFAWTFLNITFIYGRYKMAYSTTNFVMVVTDYLHLICTMIVTATVLAALLRSSLINMDKFDRIQSLFTEIDRELKNEDKNRNVFYLMFVLFHVGIASSMILDSTLITNSAGIVIYANFVIEEVLFYYSSVLVLLICSYTSQLKIRLELINDTLITLLHNKLLSLNYKSVNTKSKEVCRVRNNFNKICHLIRIFNSVFGWEILLIVSALASSLLSATNFLIVLLLTDNKYLEQRSGAIWSIVLWCGSVMVMGTAIAVTCDMTTREAQRTAVLCYDSLLDVPAISVNVEERILREELILLAQQATHQCPYFSAAGFFKVDYTMLFGLLGTVTSYVIVLIQINK